MTVEGRRSNLLEKSSKTISLHFCPRANALQALSYGSNNPDTVGIRIVLDCSRVLSRWSQHKNTLTSKPSVPQVIGVSLMWLCSIPAPVPARAPDLTLQVTLQHFPAVKIHPFGIQPLSRPHDSASWPLFQTARVAGASSQLPPLKADRHDPCKAGDWRCPRPLYSLLFFWPLRSLLLMTLISRRLRRQQASIVTLGASHLTPSLSHVKSCICGPYILFRSCYPISVHDSDLV
jgi:hypothetical protein